MKVHIVLSIICVSNLPILSHIALSCEHLSCPVNVFFSFNALKHYTTQKVTIEIVPISIYIF